MNVKNYITLIFFSVILIKPKHIYHGMSLNALIVWNTGYSQFISLITNEHCNHIDPGGTLKTSHSFVLKYCSSKENFWIKLHNDRFHTNFVRSFKKLHLKELKPFAFKASHKRLLLSPTESFPYFHFHGLLSFGHLEKQALENIFLNPDTSIYNSEYLILPNHGQPKFLNQELIQTMKRFKMRISGSQSRNYRHHQSTEKKFQKMNVPIVYKNIWGHLIFEIKNGPYEKLHF